MKPANKTLYLSMFIVLTAVSCSPVRMTSFHQEPDAKLSQYKTFDFYEVSTEGDVPAEYQQRVSLIQEEVDRFLTSRGLTKSKNNPDLLVNIGLFVEEKVQTRDTDIRTDGPRYTGQRNYSWKSETIEVGRYHEGTLTMDWVDRAKEKLIWNFVFNGVMTKNDEASKKNIQKGGQLIAEKITP